MFGSEFSHYLSYGATDQKTVIALSGHFDGLLVPGTVAAFQKEGTGGFVLAMSAASATMNYAIDPRFPLFQQALSFPKKSHEALAKLLGLPSLIRSADPQPEDFTPEIIRTVARNWADFNKSYKHNAGGKFEKYAKRLDEDLGQEDAQQPTFIFPPYLITHTRNDGWWKISELLFKETCSSVGDGDRCVRVVATSNVELLEELALSVEDDRMGLWVSGLDELTRTSNELATYGRAIAAVALAGKRTFAFYGGFFSVLLNTIGLGGASHGIGYGESRQWKELPESGPPPSRYYVPQLHRYLQPDEATRLLVADRRLSECHCPECHGDPPNTLDYQALMKHSVYCRAREIKEWSGMSIGDAAKRLAADSRDWHQILKQSGLPNVLLSAARRRAAHLQTWVDALSQIP